MYNDFQSNFPFPIPISPQMPLNQQMSMSSLNPGMATRPVPSMNYNFSEQYKKGGHVKSLDEIIELIQDQGEEGDDILAYINPNEAEELDELFGHDINPETGLPQYGLFKKIKKGFKKLRKSKKFRKFGKLGPMLGAIGGNFIAPGLGGVIGGGLGGALTGKKPLKGALTGAAIGGIQGYGLPLLGQSLTAQGMPQLGKGLELLGGSRFAGALPHLGRGLGILPMANPQQNQIAQGQQPSLTESNALIPSLGTNLTQQPKNDLASILNYITGGLIGEGGSQGDLLNKLLLGLTMAGMVGGKTKYKVPGEYKKEPSLQEIMKIVNPPVRAEDKARKIAAYVPPASYFNIPQVEEEEYGYTPFKKGGKVKKFVGGGTTTPSSQKKVIKPAVPKQNPSKTVPIPLPSSNILPDPIVKFTPKVPIKPTNINKPVIFPKVEKKPSSSLSPEVQKELQPLKEMMDKLFNLNPQHSEKNPTSSLGEEFLGSGIQYIPEEEYKKIQEERKKEKENLIPIKPYLPPHQYFDIPKVMESNYEGYTQFSKGGYIDGEDGGQDDNRPRNLPEGSYIIDATTVSLLGDGNSNAGRKKLDEYFKKVKINPQKFSKGKKVRNIKALVSDGEYEIPHQIVTAIGNGNNNKGAKILDMMRKNIRKQKKVPHLPAKSKNLSSYMRMR